MLAKRPEQPPASAGVGKGRLGFLFAMATAREHVVNDRRDDQAQELRDSEPANYGRRERLQHLRPCANAKARGNIPQTAATAAIRMGRRRRCVASSMASRAGTPQRGAARRDRARGCHHFATMPITTMSPMNEATLDVIRVTIRSKTTPATESTQDERIVTTPVEAALWISEAEDVSMTDMGEAIGAGTDSAASSVLNMPKTQVERANSTLHAIRAVFPAAGTCGTRPGLMGFEAVKAG
jgi:hypothetical protein